MYIPKVNIFGGGIAEAKNNFYLQATINVKF